MTIRGPLFSPGRIATSISFALLLIITASAAVEAASLKPPKLISASGSTRAIALESVTLKAEPFPVTAHCSIQRRLENAHCHFRDGP